MSKSARFRLFAVLALALLLFTAGSALYADTTVGEVTDGTAEISTTEGIFGTSPETTTEGTQDTAEVPESSSMLDTDLTTTPDTADTMPDHDNTLDGDNKDNDGFNYTGLIIALVIAAAVILLIILLVPKNKNKR